MKKTVIDTTKDFPQDTGTWEAIQEAISLTATLGNIAGDRVIVKGCEEMNGGADRAPGYLFLRTADYPDGEVLFWEGGTASAGMYVKKQPINISAQGYDFPAVYIVRTLAQGIGAESYKWADFTRMKTNVELYGEITGLRAEIALLVPPPLGVVQMWAGKIDSWPNNYRLCDGSTLTVAECPGLYAVLGNAFGGTPGVTFKLPDLTAKFIAGYHPIDGDHNQIGKPGGYKTVLLDKAHLPAHTHPVKDYYYSEKWIEPNQYTYDKTSPTFGSHSSDEDNTMLFYKRHDTEENTGGGIGHENRPPYFTLAYIMRLK